MIEIISQTFPRIDRGRLFAQLPVSIEHFILRRSSMDTDVGSFLTTLDVGTPRFTLPAQSRGWILLAQPSTRAPLDRIQHSLQQAGWATLAADWQSPVQLRAASDWLATQPAERGKPIGLVAAGSCAEMALRAAAHNPQITSIVTWNGRGIWLPRDVNAPTLLLLSADADWRARWFTRLAQWRLAADTERVIVPEVTSPVMAQMLSWLAAERKRPTRQTSRRPAQRAATALAIAALAVPVTLAAITAPIASAAPVEEQAPLADPFDDGIVIKSSEVRGDDAQTQPDSQPQKRERSHLRSGEQVIGAHEVKGDGLGPRRPGGSGSIALLDGSDLRWLFNDNTATTSTSYASAAAYDANFTHAVPATTAGGGIVTVALNDAFDGYNALCFSLNGDLTRCSYGDPSQVLYNDNGPATPDAQCTGVISPTHARQYNFAVQPAFADTLEVSRKVYVPDNDMFARWLNTFHNASTQTLTVTAVIHNDLGSDSGTRLVNSSVGPVSPTLTNTQVSWVTTFQDYTNPITGTSSDVRLGHVLQGPGARTGLAVVNFADRDDNPWWGYTFTLNPGETKSILNFATGQPSKAAANAQAARLVTLPSSATRCLTNTERQQIVNFDAHYKVYLPLIVK
jgi:dienelactone hydrolase